MLKDTTPNLSEPENYLELIGDNRGQDEILPGIPVRKILIASQNVQKVLFTLTKPDGEELEWQKVRKQYKENR